MSDNEEAQASTSTCDRIEQTRAGSISVDQMKSGSKDYDDQRSKSGSKRKEEGAADGMHSGKGARRGEDKGKSLSNRYSKGKNSEQCSNVKNEKKSSNLKRKKDDNRSDKSEHGLSEKQFAELMKMVKNSVEAMTADREEPKVKSRKVDTTINNIYEDMISSSEEENFEVESEESDEDVEYLGKFFGQKSVTGPSIKNKKLAETVNKNLREKNELNTPEFKELMEKYQAPDNVENVNPPKLNDELAEANSVRGPDNRAVVVQSLIGHALTAGLRLADDLKTARMLKSTVDLKRTLYTSLDIVTLLTTAFTTATKKRQEACKYAVNLEYQKVCLETKASTEWLFHDLQAKLKSSVENAKISPFTKSKNVFRPSVKQSNHRMGRFQNTKRRFLGQGNRPESNHANYPHQQRNQRPLFQHSRRLVTNVKRGFPRGKR